MKISKYFAGAAVILMLLLGAGYLFRHRLTAWTVKKALPKSLPGKWGALTFKSFTFDSGRWRADTVTYGKLFSAVTVWLAPASLIEFAAGKRVETGFEWREGSFLGIHLPEGRGKFFPRAQGGRVALFSRVEAQGEAVLCTLAAAGSKSGEWLLLDTLHLRAGLLELSLDSASLSSKGELRMSGGPLTVENFRASQVEGDLDQAGGKLRYRFKLKIDRLGGEKGAPASAIVLPKGLKGRAEISGVAAEWREIAEKFRSITPPRNF